MRRLPWFVLIAAGVAGCPQPSSSPDVTLPDVTRTDGRVDAARPEASAPDASMPEASAPDAEVPGMDAEMPGMDATMPPADVTMPPMDGGGGTPSDQIRAVQMAAAGTVNLQVDNVLVTYVVPAITGATAGNDPAGFSVQNDMTGPALFVAITPSTLMPAPAVGDRVSFRVTMTRAVNNGASRWVSAVTGYTRLSGSNPVSGLTQDLSSAADLVSAINTYDYELVQLTGTVTDNGMNSGAAFRSFAITTAGMPMGDANLRLRLPEALSNTLGVRQGCRFTIGPTTFWRFRDVAQPSAWTASDIMLSMCPPAMDGGVDAAADARVDAAADARVDSGADAGADARADAATDARPDAAADASGDAGGCTPRLVINELQSRGMGATDEFIEVFNAGTCAVNLNGWTLRYLSASSTTGTGGAVWTGTAMQSLNPGQYAVLRSGGVGAPPAGVLDLGAVMGSIGLADSGGVGLFNGTTRHDSVAYQQMGGTAVAMTHPFREGGTVATTPASGGAAIATARVPNGADTNNNAMDFRAVTMPTAGRAN